MTQPSADLLTEQLVGHKGAVRVIGKFIIRSRADAELVSPQTVGTHELWDTELIIIPKRTLADGGQFGGYRIDQMLCGGFERDNMWGNTYWTSK